MKKLLISAALLTVSSILQVHAWGQTGHRITGSIAEQYLTAEAKAAIEKLLPNESLAQASTYADEMRSNPEEFWQKEAGAYHYVTVPKDKHYHDVGAPEQGDAFTALEKFSKIVKDKTAPLEKRQRAVRFIVHIVGDLHQPLHAGDGTDKGGNDLKLEFFREQSNLHRVWDSGLIDRRQLSYTEWTNWLSEKITPEQAAAWNTTDPLVYIAESVAIRNLIYPETERLSWDYLYQHLPTATERLQKGGVRIAAYLNDLFKQ
jgi:hypothetical protein